jgi:hypothetical protein
MKQIIDTNKDLSYYTKDQRSQIISKYKQDSNFMDTLARIKNNLIIPLKNINDPNVIANINVDDPNINWDYILNTKARDHCDLQCEKECNTLQCQKNCPRECTMKMINQLEQIVWDSKPRVKKQGRVGFAGGSKSKRKSTKKIKSKRRKNSKRKSKRRKSSSKCW